MLIFLEISTIKVSIAELVHTRSKDSLRFVSELFFLLVHALPLNAYYNLFKRALLKILFYSINKMFKDTSMKAVSSYSYNAHLQK